MYLVNNLKNNYDNIHVSSRGFVDSGCTVRCCGDRFLVSYKTPALNGICVGQPDVTTMCSSHISLLPMPRFSLAACFAHVLPVMKGRCLVSVGHIFDDGFAVKFDSTHVYLQKVRLILIGNRDPESGLYYIDLTHPSIHPSSKNPHPSPWSH